MISFSQILSKLKEVFSKMIGTKSIESVVHIAPIMSSEMQAAIQLWEDMYKGQSPWLKEPTYSDPSRIVSLGLPQLIASEKARTALLEFESEITTPMKEVDTPREEAGTNIVERFKTSNTDGESTELDLSRYNTPQFHPQATVKELVPKGPTERAEYLNKTYQNKIIKKIRKQIEYGIALGGLVIKPFVIKNESPSEKTDNYDMEFDFVYANDFYPLAFNSSGDMVEAAFVQKKIDKDITYSRVEHHKYENHTVTIRNMAFKSTARGEGADLGNEIPLTAVPEWKDIEPVTTIDDVDRKAHV